VTALPLPSEPPASVIAAGVEPPQVVEPAVAPVVAPVRTPRRARALAPRLADPTRIRRELDF
jgi:hypothetical protein